jgi:hypothetical protein
MRSLRRAGLWSAALLILVLAGSGDAPAGKASPGTPTTYSGRAYVLYANVASGTATVGPLSDTGQLPSTGGFLHNSLLTVDTGPLTGGALQLTAEALSASTAGSGNEASSFASVASVALTNFGGHSIGAGVLQSNSKAECVNGSRQLSGSSSIAQLTIDGQTIAVTGAPNQTIEIGDLLKVVINEQTNPAPNKIAVNALHIWLFNGFPALQSEVVISHAESDINCAGGPKPPPPPCPVKDFVTGGGYILDGSGNKVTFGMVGGDKGNGGLSGHLNVVDHGNGKHTQGSDVTTYEQGDSGPNSRHLVYDGTIDVRVADNGEPGTSDTFNVTDGAYSRSGTLGGGNIQLHKPKGCGKGKPS